MSDGAGEILHVERLPEREALYAVPETPLAEWLQRAIAAQGIDRLYTHQAEAIERIRRGENLLVSATGGKRLCYMLPTLERLSTNPAATALFLYPNALPADERREAFARLLEACGGASGVRGHKAFLCGTYERGTSASARRNLREHARVILSSPKLLHDSLLPGHPRWARFFAGLSLVVVDDIHTYRGIFGSHVANVLRRLRRVAAHYGASPQFLLFSASLRNAQELAERLVGLPVSSLRNDGSPRGRRYIVFWNPAPCCPRDVARGIPAEKVVHNLVQLVRRELLSGVLAKSIDRPSDAVHSARDCMRGAATLADRLNVGTNACRPDERSSREGQLLLGTAQCVMSVSTLGYGMGGGNPGTSGLWDVSSTIAHIWQRIEGASRPGANTLSLVLASDNPIDQYAIRHPHHFFGRTPESAVLNPGNCDLLRSQLACAAAELPISPNDYALFGDNTPDVLRALTSEGLLAAIRSRHFWADADLPTRVVNLHQRSTDVVTVRDAGDAETVIAAVDVLSAPEVVYPGAIYLHKGESYLIQSLDLHARVARAVRCYANYTTRPVTETELHVERTLEERPLGRHTVCFGSVAVKQTVTGFRKIRIHSLDAIGSGTLQLPSQSLATQAVWWTLADNVAATLKRGGHREDEALRGLGNVCMIVLPLLTMCAPPDVGSVVSSTDTGSPTLFLYDRFPEGMGYAEHAYAEFGRLLHLAREVVLDCSCTAGCPACVGFPAFPLHTEPPVRWDPSLEDNRPFPSKAATGVLLDCLVEDRMIIPGEAA
jgi:DEAD/DEAH box helicase domain-containing protein